MPVDSSPLTLPSASLAWDEHGVPHSVEFGDVYFSRAGGVQETEYVFLRQNDLEARWRQLDPATSGSFTLAETGFGTGLNFLCAARLWLAVAPVSWRLNFVSVEQFPLDHTQLNRALASWTEFGELATALCDAYPPRLPGFHSRSMMRGRIRLQLLFGDANERLPELLDSSAPELPSGFAVDAWFLDGFAPARNPGLWSDTVFDIVGRLSRAGTTFATFTAAGAVRRGLEKAGFRVVKVPGHGSKREMLRGVHGSDTTTSAASIPMRAADYWAFPPPARRRQPVVVVGGGLAGTSTARALAERGYPVTLLEAGDRLAPGASGNPLGVLYTKLSAGDSPVSRFALASWLHALAYYREGFSEHRWHNDAGGFDGLLQLQPDAHVYKRLREAFGGHHDWVRFVDAAAASALAGCTVNDPALWFPAAGGLVPNRICDGHVNHPLIEVRLQTAAQSLDQTTNGWRVATGRGEITAGLVVIAAAHHACDFPVAAHLPLKAIRGQITLLPEASVAKRPRMVICREGYVGALPAGGLCLGATFDLDDADPGIRAESHRQNLAALEAALPDVVRSFASPDMLEGRVGFRCATPDYLPIVGALPDHDLTRVRYQDLARNARSIVRIPGAPLPGLYINVGHGSRGLTSTPICAELLAAQIAGEPRPLPRDLVHALQPARFIIRNLVRRGSAARPRSQRQ